MIVRGVAASDQGKRRTKNEDRAFADDDLGLYVVSDGMGGHAAGEVASEMAVQAFVRAVRDEGATLGPAHLAAASDAALAAAMTRAVERASAAVHAEATANPARAGMGATLTALLVGGGKAVVGHVGDTRAYLVRAGHVHQLTTDHKLVDELVASGAMAPEDAAASPYRHVLTRTVGTQAAVKVDAFVVNVVPGDRFVLCTDGLCDYLAAPDDLTPYFGDDLDLATVPEGLIAFANTSGGHDNISVVALRVDPSDADADPASHLAATARLDALGSSSLFAGLSLARLSQVLALAEPLQVHAGDVLIQDGVLAPDLLVVVSGSLSLESTAEPARGLGPGQTFNERGLVVDARASGTLLASTESRCLRIPHASLRALVRQEPALGVTLLERVARRLLRDLWRVGEV